MNCQCGTQFTIEAAPEGGPQTAPPQQQQPIPPYPQQPGYPSQGSVQGIGVSDLIQKLTPKPVWVSAAGIVVGILLIVSLVVVFIRSFSIPYGGFEVFLFFFIITGFALIVIGSLMIMYNSLIKQEELLKKILDK
jgi:hypothetical protein